MKYADLLKQGWKGMLIAIIVGTTAVAIRYWTRQPVLDPLFVALGIGIIIRSFIKFNDKWVSGLTLVPLLFIPFGAIFYGAVNLNFMTYTTVDTRLIIMTFIIFMVYIISALLLSKLMGLRRKISYLITAGSTICGASAIAISSDAVDAEPDDVSNSLIAVFVSALIGLFFIFPFLKSYLEMSGIDFGFFSGAILQFTGFVKVSVANASEEIQTLALSVKAVRYVGLIFIIPFMASMVKGELVIPWYLWTFFGAGLVFTFVPSLAKVLGPACKWILDVLWSTALAAIGLNANLKSLFKKDGLKAFVVSFISFLLAIAAFLSGMYFMSS